MSLDQLPDWRSSGRRTGRPLTNNIWAAGIRKIWDNLRFPHHESDVRYQIAYMILAKLAEDRGPSATTVRNILEDLDSADTGTPERVRTALVELSRRHGVEIPAHSEPALSPSTSRHSASPVEPAVSPRRSPTSGVGERSSPQRRRCDIMNASCIYEPLTADDWCDVPEQNYLQYDSDKCFDIMELLQHIEMGCLGFLDQHGFLIVKVPYDPFNRQAFTLAELETLFLQAERMNLPLHQHAPRLTIFLRWARSQPDRQRRRMEPLKPLVGQDLREVENMILMHSVRSPVVRT